MRVWLLAGFIQIMSGGKAARPWSWSLVFCDDIKLSASSPFAHLFVLLKLFWKKRIPSNYCYTCLGVWSGICEQAGWVAFSEITQGQCLVSYVDKQFFAVKSYAGVTYSMHLFRHFLTSVVNRRNSHLLSHWCAFRFTFFLTEFDILTLFVVLPRWPSAKFVW
jgi:hypothetical protein